MVDLVVQDMGKAQEFYRACELKRERRYVFCLWVALASVDTRFHGFERGIDQDALL